MPSALTAFTDPAGLLRVQLREAILDHDAFETPLRICELSSCRATCCHDGAILSRQEAAVIRGLLESHPGAFSTATIPDPDRAIVARGASLKTATSPAEAAQCAPGFPSHFARTRCVFLDRQHKCTLQLLSLAQGRHRWFYKPLSCWMHPILLRSGPPPGHRPLLTILRPGQDPAQFASCTPCGRPDPTGPPARETLRAELTALSEIADRDFVAELNAPSI